MSNTLTDLDKGLLNQAALSIDWHTIATAMKALNWRWYHIKDRTPTAGEIRDQALSHLADCIRHAHQSPTGFASLRSGGFECFADVCKEADVPESFNELVYLSCSFVLTSNEYGGSCDGRSRSLGNYGGDCEA